MALAALTLAPAALAHARPLETTPANGAVLAAAPREVVIRFDAAVVVASGAAAIRNGGGSVLAGPERAAGRTAVLPLEPGLADGDYTVRWRVLGDEPFRHLCICYPNPGYPVPKAKSVGGGMTDPPKTR